MFKNQNQLDQLDQQLNQAAKNHKSAERAIKKAERELKTAYQTKFRALRQLADDSRENQQNRADGGATIQTYEALNATVKKAEAEITRNESELKQAKQNFANSKRELDQAKQSFATAYRDFAEQKFQELEKAIAVANQINSELKKYGNTAWKSLHVEPVIGKGRNNDPDLISIMVPGNNALKSLRKKIG